MKPTDTRPDCPSVPSLVEWFDGLLDADAADAVEQHLDRCAACRGILLDWTERVGLPAGAVRLAPVGPADCIDAETLIAYGAAADALVSSAAVQVEAHLQRCARCVEALRHVMALQRQMTDAAPAAAASELATVSEAAPMHSVASAASRRLARALTEWRRRLGALLTPSMWPAAALATAAVVVLVIGVARLMLPGAQWQEMRVRSGERAVVVEVTAATVGRARPAVDEPIVLRLTRGTHAQWLEAAGDWTRIELADGRRVWVETRALAEVHEK